MPRIAPLIFVSSTSEDLTEYRKAIQLSFPALDVLYRGMEFFGARPHQARDVIIKELDGCDLYLGILAHRYGSRDSHSGISFTELEYRTARKNRIPTLMFLIDPDHAVPASHIEADPNAQKSLKDFKDAVSHETVVEMFRTPEDLVGRVSHSLGRLIAEKGPMWQQLRHEPLDQWDNNYIRRLYSTDPQDVMQAIGHLNKVECRAAFEHIYGLLHTVDPRSEVAEESLQKLIHSRDEDRVSQMLLNLLEDRQQLRPRVIHAIGERARIGARFVTDGEVDAVLALATESVADIRVEVAHALGKIASKRSDRWGHCRQKLEILKTDSVKEVSEKAKASLRLTARGGRPPRGTQ